MAKTKEQKASTLANAKELFEAGLISQEALDTIASNCK